MYPLKTWNVTPSQADSDDSATAVTLLHSITDDKRQRRMNNARLADNILCSSAVDQSVDFLQFLQVSNDRPSMGMCDLETRPV